MLTDFDRNFGVFLYTIMYSLSIL